MLLSGNGRFKARLEGPISGNVLLRQAQHKIVGEPAQTLALARGFIAGKLKNSRQILLRGARESTNSDEQSTLTRVTDNLSAFLRALPQAADLDTLRGIEGEAARGYFGALNLLVREDYRADFHINRWRKMCRRRPIKATAPHTTVNLTRRLTRCAIFNSPPIGRR